MPLHTLTYEFEPSGGNIEYQTTRQVEQAAKTAPVETTLVTTGLSIEENATEGTAVVEIGDDAVPGDVFQSATDVRRVSFQSRSGHGERGESDSAEDPQPAEAISAFEDREASTELLAAVNETPGRGFLLDSDLTRVVPFERDLWLVNRTSDRVDTERFTVASVVDFYRENQTLLQKDSTLMIAGFHGTDDTLRLGLVVALTDRDEARSLASQTNSPAPVNMYRLELSKASLVVGESSHGQGQVDAVFRTPSGDEVSSRELGYRTWLAGLDVSYHPLGVIVDGDLYRPATADGSESGRAFVADPLIVDTHRGGTGTPWQFGVSRHNDQLFLTQARAGPEKFDPVLKRFTIERKQIDDEPLVFSHTVSRRVWSEDPVNVHVQSNRSEGLVTQFLYAESDGWHLIQPASHGEPDESTESRFVPTALDGVSVRSSILRAEADGETKATVEHEYRVTEDVFDSCSRLYALSYYEASEESIGRLQWDIAEATAYEIVSGDEGV